MHGGGDRRTRSADSRGQTEAVATVLILAMTLIGATTVLAFGATGLDDARLSAQEGGVEHAMTQLDSRSAMVALGDSETQRVPLSAAGQGSYHVDPDAGWINVTHSDYDGEGNDTTIYNESLGVLVYERGDKRVAYQGGGVWQTQGANATMISPPEFHYQSATLTLPVIRVQGDSSVGGNGVTARITRDARLTRVFPNESDWYPETGGNFSNPVREGNVTVTVKSDYYQGWANYFRTRTSGEVSVDHADETVSVKLISFGAVGDFEMPADGNSIEIQGLGDGHPITDFNVTLRPDGGDNADFNNLQWTLYAEQGNQEFEIHLRKGSNANVGGTDCNEVTVDIAIYYSESNGDSYHGWQKDDAFTTSCDDLDGDGTGESNLEVNLTGTTQLTLDKLGNNDLEHFDGGNDNNDTVTFDEHDGVTWEQSGGKQFSIGGDETTTIGNLTNHYLSLMGPNIELTVEDKSSNTISEERSDGFFEQDGGTGSFITFLHITENRVVIELE